MFSPKAIAGIGKLPDTIADRAIPIELRRRRRGDHVERFRQRKVEPDAVPLYSAAAAWAVANLRQLTEAEPELPDELDDRAQDIVEPLLAIADAAGGEWPERARHAAVALLTGEHRDDAESLGVRLLRDIREVFGEEGKDRLSTSTILEKLRGADEAPWGSLRGEPLDARGLGRLLKPYGIAPKKLREGSETFKGYQRAHFEDSWSRYLPTTPDEGEHGEQREHPANRVDARVHHTKEQGEHETPHRNGDVHHVPDVHDDSGTREDALIPLTCIHGYPEGEGCYSCDPDHPHQQQGGDPR